MTSSYTGVNVWCMKYKIYNKLGSTHRGHLLVILVPPPSPFFSTSVNLRAYYPSNAPCCHVQEPVTSPQDKDCVFQAMNHLARTKGYACLGQSTRGPYKT